MHYLPRVAVLPCHYYIYTNTFFCIWWLVGHGTGAGLKWFWDLLQFSITLSLPAHCSSAFISSSSILCHCTACCFALLVFVYFHLCLCLVCAALCLPAHCLSCIILPISGIYFSIAAAVPPCHYLPSYTHTFLYFMPWCSHSSIPCLPITPMVEWWRSGRQGTRTGIDVWANDMTLSRGVVILANGWRQNKRRATAARRRA